MPRHRLPIGAGASLLAFSLVLSGCATRKDQLPGGGATSAGDSGSTLTSAEMEDFEKTTLSGPRGGAIVLGDMGSGARTFNILLANETSSTGVVGPMFEGMITRDADTLEMKPSLAKSWESSPDGKTWTFHLRKGVKWSDGHPFTADDVIFTLNLIYDEKVETSQREILKIDGKPLQYKKLDDATVQIVLPTPFGPFLDVAGFTILPKHKLEAAWKAGKFNETWGTNTPPSELVGTGPFLLTEYKAAEKVVYRRNPYFWRLAQDGTQLPFLENRLVTFVPDQNALLLKFKGGETDTLGVRAEDWADVEKEQQSGNYTAKNLGATWGMNFITFNLNPKNKKMPQYKRDWFSKKEFRQAVSYALNRQSMVETVFRGLARPHWSPVSEANKVFYNPEVMQYPHNPEKSKALLAGMGFKDKNGDGILEDGAGHEVSFLLMTNVENSQRINLCNIIQDDLKKVGIKVTVSPGEFNSIVARLNNSFDWECVMMGFTGGPEPHTGKSVWTSVGNLHMWHPRQEKPATAWEAEIDRIFSEAAKLTDTAKRKVLYDRWQAIAAEQQPLIFLVTPEALVAIRNKVQNTRPTALAGPIWNREEIAIQS